MLRLLYASTSDEDGGSDRYGIRLAAAMRARGAAVTYACRSGFFIDAECRARGIPTRPFYLRNSGDPRGVIGLVRLILEEQPDVVHLHRRRDFAIAGVAVALARVLCRRRGITLPHLVLHLHLIRPLGAPARPAGRFFQRTADAVLVVSEAAREFLNERHQLPPGFVRVLPNGVPLEEYAASGDPRAAGWRTDLRRAWNIPVDAFLIGMVGRLRRKGQDELIAVAPCLAERFPHLRFVLVGPEFKPGDRTYYAERIRAAGVADRFLLAGSREDIPAVMASLDLLVHLPADEAFGLVLVEAMAAGVPVVATKVGGCIEVVRDGMDGLLVPPADEDLLCAALLTLLDPEKGEARRTAFRTAGLLRARDFSLDRQVERLHMLYEELCATP